VDRSYLVDKIAAIKALIDAYEAALLALGGDGAIQSYTLDTGQSRQTVTRAELPAINRMIDVLYARLAAFEARLYGSSITARPNW
jgi:hypothetical protein